LYQNIPTKANVTDKQTEIRWQIPHLLSVALQKPVVMCQSYVKGISVMILDCKCIRNVVFFYVQLFLSVSWLLFRTGWNNRDAVWREYAL